MNKFKLWVLWIVLWQIITVLYKDENLRNKLKESDWMWKLKMLFDERLNLNKKIFSDLKNIDYIAKKKEIENFLDTEWQRLEKSIDEIMSKAKDFNSDTVKPMLTEFELKTKELIKYANETITDVNEKYKVQERMDKVKQKLDELKNKFEKQ